MHHHLKCLLAGTALLSTVTASSLADVCTNAFAQAALPSDEVYPGITIDASSTTAQAFYNVSVSKEVMYPDATFDYCNVTFAYTHNGRNDQVLVTYWLPAPADFKNRFLSTGGGGYAINSGNTSVAGGIPYGAAAGLTDGGFGSFTNNVDAVSPLVNGTTNWEAVYMFGYQGIHEMTVLGKAFTQKFYSLSSNQKLYSYYQGCSEGGREGWSQVQRYGDQFDGAIIGAPAIRYAFQQVQHLYSNVLEQSLDYYPPPCELQKILNETITLCDPLDGKTDGVVARTDLCSSVNISSIIGTPYYCPASPAVIFPPSAALPVQNGTVSAQGVDLASKIIAGLHNSQGQQVYFSYTPSSAFVDAQTQYNFETDSFELYVSSLGGEWVERWIKLLNASNLPDLDGVTVDTLQTWIYQGLQTYEDSLETTWPDLTPFQSAGGKVLHYHGESDFSIPTASSVRYHESVREIMYPGMSFNDSTAALSEWYKLYLVQGAAHCSPNPYEPNGPFPQTNLAIMIDWVENGNAPTTLNGTILQGEHIGENQQICEWPLRPLWTNGGDDLECVYDQASVDSWQYDLDAFKVPIY